MIFVAFQAINVAAMELYESMGPTFGSREVTNIALFDELKEQEQLQSPGSSRMNLEH